MTMQDYSGMEWNELQALAKERLGSGAGSREEIEAALREQDDAPTGDAQQDRDAQADAAAAGTDQAEGEGAPTIETATGTYKVTPEATGRDITEAVADSIGVEPQNARAYEGGTREEGGSVRPADARFLDPATTETPDNVDIEEGADDNGDR